jgi:hypothetical protein
LIRAVKTALEVSAAEPTKKFQGVVQTDQVTAVRVTQSITTVFVFEGSVAIDNVALQANWFDL